MNEDKVTLSYEQWHNLVPNLARYGQFDSIEFRREAGLPVVILSAGIGLPLIAILEWDFERKIWVES